MKKERLLIAEDDGMFSVTLRREFEERGYEVLVVDQEGDASVSFAPEAAIIDLRLGRENGMNLVRTLRAKVPSCRIVILTGYGSIASAVEAIKLGCADYLTKPVDMDELATRVSGVRPEPKRTDLKPRPSLARMEREYIELVMRECGGNISQAAREIGIHRQSLQRKLRKYPPKI